MAPLAAFPLLPHSLPRPFRISYQNHSLVPTQKNSLVSTIPFWPGLRLPSHHRNLKSVSATDGSLSAPLRASKLISDNSSVKPFLRNIRDSRKPWFSSGSSRGAVDRFSRSARARNRASPIAARVAKSAYNSRRVLPFRALLALSAAAAVIFLRRRRSLQQMKARGSTAFKEGEQMAPRLKKIDSHVHVWSSPDEAYRFPYYPGQEPTLPGSAEDLLKCMAGAGVDGAVIIQPINHKFDHSYVSSILQKYPNKFLGMCLADPTEGGGGVKELERLVEEESKPLITTHHNCWLLQEGYKGVRFNPYLWPSGQQMTNDVGKAMFAKAGELEVPVGFMCFKGLSLHIDEIEELCREFPSTTVLMDHLGFCKPPLNEEETKAWTRLLNLSKYPQVYVKLSAFFRVSRETFPYKDTWLLLKQLRDSFGANHLMWGSDFPFVAAECGGYAEAWQVLPPVSSAEAFLSEEELEYLMGGTALAVFRGSWRNPSNWGDEEDLDNVKITQM